MTSDAPTFRLSDVLAALSPVLDRVEGQPDGHTMRTCVIGMTLAERLDLPNDLRGALFYALLLKDAGCSSNAARVAALFDTDDFTAKREFKTVDTSNPAQKLAYIARTVRPDAAPWARAQQFLTVAVQGERAAREMIQIRCERGATIARTIGFPAETAAAIHSLDEHWDGTGYPDGLRGAQIPLLGRICSLAQTVEVFARTYGLENAIAMAEERAGRWFDPQLVDLLHVESRIGPLWDARSAHDLAALIARLEPEGQLLAATEDRLDRVAAAFAQIIDAKSPYTFQHSARVARIAVAMATVQGLPPVAVRDLRRAALLHDIGKLGISNQILDKPGKLTDAEIAIMGTHPALTAATLERIAPFRGIAAVASAHHERLDGSGYHRGLTAAALGTPERILAVADIYEALTSDRPYRPALSLEEAIAILSRERARTLCAESVDTLIRLVTSAHPAFRVGSVQADADTNDSCDTVSVAFATTTPSVNARAPRVRSGSTQA